MKQDFTSFMLNARVRSVTLSAEGNAGEYICQCRCHTELILHERSKSEAPVLRKRIMLNRVKPPYMTKYEGGTALGLVINGHSMVEVIFIHRTTPVCVYVSYHARLSFSIVVLDQPHMICNRVQTRCKV
ncbi:hypothetical protein ACSQ67_007337 [Phaseolus vulgaris]